MWGTAIRDMRLISWKPDPNSFRLNDSIVHSLEFRPTQLLDKETNEAYLEFMISLMDDLDDIFNFVLAHEYNISINTLLSTSTISQNLHGSTDKVLRYTQMGHIFTIQHMYETGTFS